ncbi:MULTISPECIES: helix-turn-helix domain-containing protein [Streptomyces]|uniref:helix-turn-helix domain-containing protein n=1 Tax=Streptomyces TaxID=1883 RepID=UPI00099611B8
MALNANATVRRGRLGAELRRLREVSGLTSRQVVDRLLISQPRISHLENGRRAIRPRDVRDLCVLHWTAVSPPASSCTGGRARGTSRRRSG